MSLKLRLIPMSFLQFAAWGAYLTSMGSYWANVGLANHIWMFYGMQGIVSIFMPALMGIVADRWMSAHRVLSLCHALSGLLMLTLGLCMASHSAVGFPTIFAIYSLSVAFYMPTLALSNSVAYNAFESAGMDSVSHFPTIRVFGTIGFICAMLATNYLCASDGTQFQHSYHQFLLSGILGLVLACYALTLPASPYGTATHTAKGISTALGLDAFALLKERRFAVFFIFSMLMGASLQITNGYANPYISHFSEIPEFAHTWGARNANALVSLSQISETLCILLIPFCFRRLGVKWILFVAMLAWVLRFALLGWGDTGSGLWLLVLSCIIYGVAFDFFNISGSLYIDQSTPAAIRSSSQGLFMLMTNGLGSTLGTCGAGWVVNHYVFNAAEPDWTTTWLIFAGYALAVAILFLLLFRDKEVKKDKNTALEQ